MLKNNSVEFKTFFLLQFTKELIRNSGAKDFIKLEEILKNKKIKSFDEIEKNVKKTDFPRIVEIKPLPKLGIPKPLIPARKKIPELKIPARLNYLKPIITNVEIDLGKLNGFIKDPHVTAIECHGEEEKIIVRGDMGIKPTNLILNKDEINNIIEKFFTIAKIPLHEGLFKIAVGKFILIAIVSEVVDSKFIIRKNFYPTHYPPY